jgi:hypothetical protein
MAATRSDRWATVRRRGFGHFVLYRGVVMSSLVAAWFLLLAWAERRYNLFGAQLFFRDMWGPLLVLFVLVGPAINIVLTVVEWHVREWVYERRGRPSAGA